MYAVKAEQLYKIYTVGRNEVRALDGVSLFVKQGEMLAVVGRSGSGKSTLMNIIGCIDRPTKGSCELLGEQTQKLGSDGLARLRNEKLGFIFQGYNLVPSLTALENAALPLLYRGVSRAKRNDVARRALEAVELESRQNHKPGAMSGGQQQRVAIARAIAAEPQLLLADEPTGNLDSRSGEQVLNLLQEQNRAGMTVIIVTHDMGVARRCGRIVTVSDGKIVCDEGGDCDERA